jgi:PAS domain S-box-containing protein
MSRLRATELALEESAALRASEARFRVFLEADPNAILAADEAGRVTWATRSSADLFAYPDSQLLGQDLADLLELPGADGGLARIAPGEIRRLETTAARGDGSTLPVEVALRQLDVDGRPTTVAIVSDATWREEANQIRDRFVGILSHELRTPITSIYGGAQLLLKRGADLDAATRTDLLVGLADESDRLQRMIENLLILDRVERGADFFGPRPVLVQRVLAAVIDHERALWPAIEVHLDVAGDLPVVTGDEDQLAQVLRNLISNAGKYAGDRATIEVRARFDSGWVRVTVTDDGPGFPADEADQLFSLYYRSARSRAAPGAGIGLYVCRNLVEAMGGTIWARAVPTGGAEFGFTLPPYVDVDDVPAVAARADDDRDDAGPADALAAAAS